MTHTSRHCTPARWLATASVSSLLLVMACTGRKPTPETPDVPREGEDWDNRWLGVLTARLGNDSPEEAVRACEALGELSGGAWSGVSPFTLELNARGTYTPRDFSGKGDEELQRIRSSEMGRFCRIEARSDGARDLADREWELLAKWLAENKGTAAPELPTVVPLGLTDNVTETTALVGAVEPMLAGVDTPLVRVVVADTEPAGAYDPTKASATDHGGATARIIYSLLCDSSKDAESTKTVPCGVEITTLHAMPYAIDESRRVSVARPDDGRYGTHESLASAIHSAVLQYVRDPKPTILNLSLGWNAGHDVDIDFSKLAAEAADAPLERQVQRRRALQDPTRQLDGTRRLGSWKTPPSRASGTAGAVYEALVRARCAGILPIASAGNRTNITPPNTDLQDGPLLPGGWMIHENRSSSDTCTAHGLTNRGWKDGTPLVYAVSGVDRQARPLGIGRPSSNAPLAALGLGVTVPDPTLSDEKYYKVSGTSASASVATAAVAGAWARGVSLAGDAVMEAVYTSGSPALAASDGSDVSADFGDIAGETKTRIVQICEAANAVSPKGRCPSSSPRMAESSTASRSTSTSSGVGNPVPAALDCEANPTTAPCGARYAPTPDALINVWPQPPSQTCPPCDLEIQTAASAPLSGVFTFRTPEATPFWQTPAFTTTNSIRSYHIELTNLIGQTQIVSFTSPSERALFEGTKSAVDVALSTSMNVFSATLVLNGQNTLTGRQKSWVVPLPFSKP